MSYDYIIIGSGIAGTILANELSNLSKSILLIECGNKNLNKFYKQIYYGNISDKSLSHGKIDEYRNLALGGTSLSWGGAICKLDESDFKKKDIDNENFWPFEKNYLDKFYKKTEKYFEINGRLKDHLKEGTISLFTDKKTEYENFVSDILIRKYGKSTNFQKYLGNKNFNLEINTQVIDFEIINYKIQGVITFNYEEKKKKIFRGKKVIICTGGIESTRLVLSTKIFKNIRNKSIVGKYYSPHISMPIGVISKIDNKSPDIIFEYCKLNNKLAYKPFLKTCKNLIENEKLLNSRFIFNMNLDKFYQYLNTLNSLSNKNFINSILPKNNLLVQLDSDQTPNIKSRIFLSKEKNIDSLNRIELEHQIIPEDYQKIDKIINLLSIEMLNKGWRLYKISNKKYNKYIHGMSHHMGTLKMSKNIRKGVVNENLKFFDFENLYLCSSSCFPTYGHANPSFTIGALACMLASYLKKC